MLHAPLLPTLLRLATPNVIGLFAMTVVIGYDGYILGRLGADALAGIALVFPLSMLMMQMSGGGIGGAVHRRRGARAGRRARRRGRPPGAAVAVHRRRAGGRCSGSCCSASAAACTPPWAGAAQRSTRRWPIPTCCSGGAVVIWATNVLGAVVRGAGNMLLPALLLVLTALIHLVLCPTLVFGWGPSPAWAWPAPPSAC